MKALILCAGLGTRLLPHTRHIPKPLFPLDGMPLLDHTIQRLIRAGCREIMVNTHHLHHMIEAFIANRRYAIPVRTRFEPRILGTGGAIKNIRDFWDNAPLMVINGDIVTDIDLESVYTFHLKHEHPATLVLYDYPPVNTVVINPEQMVVDFAANAGSDTDTLQTGIQFTSVTRWTFTGIQVIDPEVLNWIPDTPESSSIDMYRAVIQHGLGVQGYVPANAYWKDIGTPVQYQSAALDFLAPRAFRKAFPDAPSITIRTIPIAGDGSDRLWRRLSTPSNSLIAAIHGIDSRPQPDSSTEADAYIAIGRHLHRQQVAVPQIFMADRFSGIVLAEDLGDTHLQSVILKSGNPADIFSGYQKAVHLLIQLSTSGAHGFDTSWTYQTPEYDKAMILEKECRYFVEAFLQEHMQMSVRFTALLPEFNRLADNALQGAVTGFMHRDFQSRNIMMKNGRLFAIDFQAGRKGPIQYDLASLLIDPYVNLAPELQETILAYGIRELSRQMPVHRSSFIHSYRHCRITRNLQILGAFGFLTKSKGKSGFSAYIPAAIHVLNQSLSQVSPQDFPQLTRIAAHLQQDISLHHETV